jgi:hypothetical protein
VTQMSTTDMGFEAILAMGAGSDTTSTTLSNVIYYLITHPTVFARLRAELDAAVGGEGLIDTSLELDQLGELKYLQAVIDETLRLQPAIPNGVQRTAHNNQGPLSVAGYIIPPGTSVQIPTWSRESLHLTVRSMLMTNFQSIAIRGTFIPHLRRSGLSAGCPTKVPRSPRRRARSLGSSRARTCLSITAPRTASEDLLLCMSYAHSWPRW